MRHAPSKPVLIAALLAVLLTNGLHIAALQGVAWIRMYADNQKTLSPLEAIEQTLSGNELCSVCQLSLNLRDLAEDAAADFYSAPSIPLILALDADIVSASRQSGRLSYTIPLSRIPEKTILDIEPPPPKASIS